MADTKNEFDYQIDKSFGDLCGDGEKGAWVKEVNLISWNGNEAVYDIRSWKQDHEKMGKGITLTEEELKNLKELLNKINL